MLSDPDLCPTETVTKPDFIFDTNRICVSSCGAANKKSAGLQLLKTAEGTTQSPVCGAFKVLR